jgi:hypothetical protein
MSVENFHHVETFHGSIAAAEVDIGVVAGGDPEHALTKRAQ